MFGKVDVERLTDVVDRLDGLLTSSLDALLRQHAELLGPQCVYHTTTGDFIVDRQHLKLHIAQAILEPHILEVALISVARAVAASEYMTHLAQLSESGQYRQVRVSAPRGVNLSLESIALVAEAVYGTGSRWLEETTKDVADKEMAGAGHDIYRLVRELLPESSIVADVWMVAFSGQKGCYLLDRMPTDEALARLSLGMGDGAVGPISLTAKLMTTVLSYAEAHSRFAIEAGKCINVSLENSAYSDSNTLFLEAEKVIFGSPDISIFPILATGSGQLLAIFPTKHREILEPFFSAHGQAIADRFLLSRSRFKQLLASLMRPRQALAYGKVGEFVGGLLKSVFLDS